MKTILVANPKGGAGKTTLATNLAGYLAREGEEVFLWDLDRQRSSLQWLAQRSDHLPAVHRLDSAKKKTYGAWVVLDTPAGLHGDKLSDVVEKAYRIVVPIVPSLFDMAATQDFLKEILEEKALRKGKAPLAIVGMRVDARTRSAEKLDQFLEPIDLPVVTHLRDTQIYVNAAFEGKSIFDLTPSATERDREQWQPLVEWIR